MDDQLKQRLVGAAVLVAVAVIFIPMMLDDSEINDPAVDETNIPPRPQTGFSSRIIPLDVDDLEEPAGSAPSAATQPQNITENAIDTDAGGEPQVDPASSGPRVGVTAWVVQLGSFASADNASALEERLKSSGYSAFVEKVLAREGVVYRVRVGPELLRADAQALRNQLDVEVRLEGIVVRYP